MRLDFVIVNGENAAGGRGITGKITIELLRAGVSVVTTGDHIWDQKEIVSFLALEPRLLRPLNYPDGAPGGGSIVLETAKGKIGVINVQARTFMQPILENPFHALETAVTKMRQETANIIVDAHGETTSEKIALGRFLDGKVSAVIGTHTHVQTADEQIFPGGTAFLCDAGMCGPVDSILGRAIEPIMNRFVSNLPASFPVAAGKVRLRGALIEIDETPAALCGLHEWTSRDQVSPPHPRLSQRPTSNRHLLPSKRKELRLRPSVPCLSFEFFKRG